MKIKTKVTQNKIYLRKIYLRHLGIVSGDVVCVEECDTGFPSDVKFIKITKTLTEENNGQ